MNDIEELAGILRSKHNVLVFTGAGISTESGIPDFRSKGEGLWERIDPELLSVRTLRSNPALFYRYFQPMQAAMQNKQPNDGHRALAQMERLGIVKTIVTQNIDGLHQKSGSTHVLEVHGNLRSCYCERCRQEYPYAVLQNLLSQTDQPVSSCCGAALRPSVVLFGDQMPPDFFQAHEAAFQADFALVIGTSLTVYPAAEIPLAVGKFAIMNREATPLDAQAELTLQGSVGEMLTELLGELQKER